MTRGSWDGSFAFEFAIVMYSVVRSRLYRGRAGRVSLAVGFGTPVDQQLACERRARTARRQYSQQPPKAPQLPSAPTLAMDLFPLVRAENADGIRQLLREPGLDVNVKNEVGQTPLVRFVPISHAV